MTEINPTGGFSRRRFLELGAGAAAAASLAACGGGKSADEAANPQSTGQFTGGYDGPAVTLSYWNGFTGGDGPFMKKMVAAFMKENPKITVKSNTVEWAQYYQRMPAAVTAGKGPDVGVMHLDQLATNAARKVIVPVDDLAEALELTEDDFTPEVWTAGIYKDARYGIPLDVHSLAMYYNTEPSTRRASARPATDEASFTRRWTSSRQRATSTPFWMPQPVAGPPDVPQPALAERRRAVRRGRRKATFDSDAGRRRPDLDAGHRRQGYSPKNVAQDSQYVAFKTQEGRRHLGRHLADQRPQGRQVPTAPRPVPKIGDSEAVWANSHNFYITQQAYGGREQAAGVQGLHRLDEPALGRLGRVRHDPGPQVGPRERRDRRHAAGVHRGRRSTP